MFTPGTPIEEFSQDELHRERYARRLADALLSYEEASSLVVGLDGSWGTGKTSILNLVVKAMGERTWARTPIVVRFNPWYFSDQENLLRQFFRALCQRLGQRDLAESYANAAENIDTLAELVDTVGDSAPFLKIGGVAIRWVGKRRRSNAARASTLDNVKEQISSSLVQGGRRVIVLIDDIDRLTKSEVRLIFRLVKVVADFRYVTYVLAFDEIIVKEALQEVGGDEFIDKIINVPLNVPSFTAVQIQRLVIGRLNRFAEGHQEYKWDGNDRAYSVIEYLTRTFKNIRHLERMLNTLNFNGTTLRNEVDYFDLISIMALRATNPEAYRFVRSNGAYLLYTARSRIDKDGSDKQAKNAVDAFLELQPEATREAVSDLLAEMFPRFNDLMERHRRRDRGDEHVWNKERRICSERSFDAYFVFDIPEGDIAAERVSAILASPTEESFSSDLRQLVEEGNDVALTFLERLGDHLDDEGVQSSSRPIVKALLNLGDIFPVDVRGFPFKLDGHDLVMRLVYQITKRIPSEQERFEVLRDAVSDATESIYAPATTVSIEDQTHRRFEDSNRARNPSGEGELVSDEHLDELEQIMCAKIEEWAAEGRLAPHERLPYLLFRWRNWSDYDTVSNYVLTRLDDRNFVRLVVLMGREQANRMFEGGPSLRGSSISRLAEVTTIRERLRQIMKSEPREQVADEFRADADSLASENDEPGPSPQSNFQRRLQTPEPSPADDLPTVD